MKHINDYIKKTFWESYNDAWSSVIDPRSIDISQFISNKRTVHNAPKHELMLAHRDLEERPFIYADKGKSFYNEAYVYEAECTDSLESTIADVSSRFETYIWQMQVDNMQEQGDASGARIIYVAAKIGNNADIIADAFKEHGYFECRDRRDIKAGGYEFTQLTFEPEHEVDMLEELRKHTNFICHLAPASYEDRIDTEGLLPKSENSIDRYPERIFFIKGQHASKSMLYRLADRLHSKNYKSCDEYVIYKVFLDDVSQPVFYDPDSKYAVYLEKPIDASLLHKYKERISLKFG